MVTGLGEALHHAKLKLTGVKETPACAEGRFIYFTWRPMNSSCPYFYKRVCYFLFLDPAGALTLPSHILPLFYPGLGGVSIIYLN